MKAAPYTVHVVLRTGIVKRLAINAASLNAAHHAARNAAMQTFPCRWLSYSVRLA